MIDRESPWQRLLHDRALLESLLASVLMLLLTLGASWLAAWLWVHRQAWRRHRPMPGDAVVLVCGHALDAGRPSRDYRRRLERAGRLLAEQPGRHLVLLGGGSPSEAAVGRDWLVRTLAVDPGRIRLEEQSGDSFENLHRACDLIAAGRPVVLLSSRYHLARLGVFARQLGLRATLAPAETRRRPDRAYWPASAREAAFVCWFVSGRLWARLARREALLSRIR